MQVKSFNRDMCYLSKQDKAYWSELRKALVKGGETMLGQKILLNSYRNASRMLRQPSKELREKKFFQFIQKKTEVVTAHEDKRLALYEKKIS